MCDDVDSVIVQVFEKKDGWKYDDEVADQGGSNDFFNDCVCEDYSILQRRVDGYIVIKGYGQQDCRVSYKEEVDEEYLGEVVIKGNVIRIKLEVGQCFWYGGSGE